jgi:plastocyanin
MIAAAGMPALAESGDSGNRKVAALDNCDPTDPAWVPGGCLNRNKGDNNVTTGEFFSLIFSPLSDAVVGHPSWRFEPAYVSVEAGKKVRLSNDGGRPHTFTKVVQFGGGRVPPLNNPGLRPAPECALAPGAVDPNEVAAGRSIERTFAQGEHRLQCCFHPWMRMVVKAEAKKENKGGDR